MKITIQTFIDSVKVETRNPKTFKEFLKVYKRRDPIDTTRLLNIF